MVCFFTRTLHISFHIAVKELFLIVLAIETWGNSIRHKNVLFMSGHNDVVQIIDKQSSKDKTIMRLVQ